MPGVLPKLPVGCSWNWRYIKNQTAMFAPLTMVNRPHHQARGFDQAKEVDTDLDRELDRVRHSKLIDHTPSVTELTPNGSNSVTNRGPVTTKICVKLVLSVACWRGESGASCDRWPGFASSWRARVSRKLAKQPNTLHRTALLWSNRGEVWGMTSSTSA
jgi:hypothetical protein